MSCNITVTFNKVCHVIYLNKLLINCNLKQILMATIKQVRFVCIRNIPLECCTPRFNSWPLQQ